MTILKDLQTPVFAAEGILRLDPGNHTLLVDGLINSNLTFAFEELKINMRLTSVSGWSVRADWDGVLWRDFLAFVCLDSAARYAFFSAASDYSTCVLLSDLAASSAMLAWGVGGQPLEAEYGGPLRMVIPNLWGYKSCKWLTRITFAAKYETGYWERRGYTHRGEIEPGETFDVNSKKYRPIAGGEVTEY